jgi:hypothetical protein
MELYYCSNYPKIMYPKTTTPKIICSSLQKKMIQKSSYKKYCKYFIVWFQKAIKLSSDSVPFPDSHKKKGERGGGCIRCDVGGADADDACDGGDAQESRWSGGGCFPLQLVWHACGGGCCVGKSSGVAADERDM